MWRASVLAVDRRPKPGTGLSPEGLERLFNERHALVWRTLRRLGLAPLEAAETTQRVFAGAAKELGGVQRREERAKLLALALRDAFRVDCGASVDLGSLSEVRVRPALARRPPARSGFFWRRGAGSHAGRVDLMDRVLSHMPRPEAAAFILFELEGLSLREVAQVLTLDVEAARGAVLHARSEFKSIVAALRATSRR